MTIAFKRKNLTAIVLAAILIAFSFSSVFSAIVSALPEFYASVILTVSPPGSGSFNIFLMENTDETISSPTTLTLGLADYQLTATANSGFIFSSWSTSTPGITFSNSQSISTTASIYDDGTITAIFTPVYQVSFTTSGGGGSTTSPSGTHPYTAGEQVSINVNTANGYSFVSWGTSTPSITFASSTSASTTARINAAGTITANFVPLYTVSFATSSGGSSMTSPSGTKTYTPGQRVPITAIPASGYSFASWFANGSITFVNASSVSTNATINSSGVIIAAFTPLVQVSFSAIGGGASTISPSGTQVYTVGHQVLISANAASGYRFVSWSAVGPITFANSNLASTTATINGAANISAAFTQLHQVSFATIGGGSSTISPIGTQTYSAGQQVTITADPASGYEFSDWTASPSNAVTFASASSSSTIATIIGSATVTAKFVEKPTPTPTTVTPGPSDSSSITPGPSTITPKPSSTTPSPTAEVSPTPTQSPPLISDIVQITAVAVTVAVIASLGAGFYLSHLLRPSLQKFGRDFQKKQTQEIRNEEQEEKEKERDRKKKKPFLKLEIKVPLMLWGSKSAIAEGKVLNEGVASAKDIQVSAIATPGLVLNKNAEKISVLKPFEQKSLSFPFTASNRIKRGNYTLRFKVKSKETSSRVKDRSLRAMKIGLLSDNVGRRNLVSLKQWLSDHAVSWDEVIGADSFMKLLQFDLLVIAYESEMPSKWVKNISNFVNESQSLLVINTINTSNIELISQTLGYNKMLFEDFGLAERSLVVLDNNHEATKTMPVGREIPLGGRSRICTSNTENGLILAKQDIRNGDEEKLSKVFPGIVANNYGQGRAIYLNFCLEQPLFQKDEIFENLFNWLIFKNTTCGIQKDMLSN